MKNILVLLLWIIFNVFVPNNIHAQNAEKEYDHLLNELFSTDGPGGAALVAVDGQVVYRKAFGKANLELDVNMKPNHVFRVGSITKQFTACAILKLKEDGKLSLQDDITKFIEGYPTQGYEITIEHLLTHTSGIKSFTSIDRWDADTQKKDFTTEEMIAFFKDEPIDFPPGEKFEYNNSAYFLLGYIIEQISGMSYASYLDEAFFKPLGMKDTYLDEASKIINNRVSGYKVVDGEYKNADYINMSQVYSAGAMLSTVDDLSIWYNSLVEGKVISKESLKMAHTSFVLNNGKETGNGYGWFLGDIKGSPIFEHGGGINGFLSSSLYITNENVFVVVLSNCECNETADVAFKMGAIAIDENDE